MMTSGRQGRHNRSASGLAAAHGPCDTDVGIAPIDHTYKHSSVEDVSGTACSRSPDDLWFRAGMVHRGAPFVGEARQDRGPGRLRLADGDLKDPALEVLDSTRVYPGYGDDITPWAGTRQPLGIIRPWLLNDLIDASMPMIAREPGRPVAMQLAALVGVIVRGGVACTVVHSGAVRYSQTSGMTARGQTTESQMNGCTV